MSDSGIQVASRQTVWQYVTLAWGIGKTLSDMAADLNTRGSDGWELVAFMPSLLGTATAILKRPIG
jgi:hypothetical protein